MWKKLLSVLGIIGILIAASVVGQIGKGVGSAARSLSKTGPQEIEAKLIEGFTKAAEQYNRTLPMMVDQDTRLEKVTVGPGPRIVYHHTFPSHRSRDIDANWLKASFRPEVGRKACANPDMRESLQYGGIYAYTYSGNDGIEITRFEIDRNDCRLPESTP